MKHHQLSAHPFFRSRKHPPGKWLSATILSGFLICTHPCFGEEPGYEKAVSLAMAGNHSASEAIYDDLIMKNPDSLQFLMGRAYVRSWQKHHLPAREDFEKVLKIDPQNTEALIGLGYNFAWAGKSGPARKSFFGALRVDPSIISAKKGLAFTALWQGKGEEAVHRFRKIRLAYKSDAEAAVGLGRAYLLTGKKLKAKKSFQDALNLEPGRRDALAGLKEVSSKPSSLEISIWAGYTSGTGATGIRSAEIGGWLSRDLRLWGRYDNALSLDNPGLVREGIEIPSFFLGGLNNWGKKYTTRLEVGRRDLLHGINQFLFQAEQVAYLVDNRSVKIGGFIGPRDDGRTDWNIYTGAGVPLLLNSRIEPTFFYTKTGGVKESEWRLLIPLEHRFSEKLRSTVHLATGKVSSEIPGASGSLWAAGAIISARITTTIEGHFLLKHESPPLAEEFTVLSIGFTFRPGKE